MSANVEQELEELRQRVSTLEAIVVDDGVEPDRDKYDRYVLKKLRDAEETVFTRQLHIWYRQSGIRSRDKRRDRVKALAQDGLIEPVGQGGWRYAGPKQDTLGVR